MTVKELIMKLKKHPGNAIVTIDVEKIDGTDSDVIMGVLFNCPIYSIRSYKNPESVTIEVRPSDV